MRKLKINILNNTRIRNKLLLSFAGVIIIPIVSIAFFLTQRLTDTTLKSTETMAEVSAFQLKNNIINTLSTYAEMVELMKNDIELNEYANTVYNNDYEAYQDYLKYVQPLVEIVQFKDASAKIKIYINNESIGFSGITNNPLDIIFDENMDLLENFTKGEVNWIPTSGSFDRSIKENYLGCCHLMLNPQQRNIPKMMYAVYFDENKLHNLFSEKEKSGDQVFLFDSNGSLITGSSRDFSIKNENELLTDSKENISLMDNKSIIRYQGKQYMIWIASVDESVLDISNWQLIYLTSTEDIMETNKGIIINSMILGLLCFVASVIIIAMISRSITSRLERLTFKIKEVEKGRFNITSNDTANDEIGIVESNFDNMVSMVDKLINDVYNAQLKLKDTEIKNSKMQSEKQKAQLIAMKRQINPHYISNTLESIRMNLIIKGDKETADIIYTFAQGFKKYIYTNDEILILRDELKFIENYFAIEKYKGGDIIKYQFKIEDEVLDCQIPSLIIQPLVENALMHGIGKKIEGGTVIIEGFKVEEDLVIRVIDDGVGIDKEKMKQIETAVYGDEIDESAYSESFQKKTNEDETVVALSNVHKRLRLRYGSEYGIKLKSIKGKGTTIEINIPFHTIS